MTAWLRARLSGWVRALQSEHRSPEAGEELGYLRSQLARVDADLESLARMLSRSTDSFRAGLATGTTAHADSLRQRRSELLTRIAAAEAADGRGARRPDARR